MNTLRISRGAAIDFLVLLLALILFLTWALGSVYLTYFPSSGSSAATSSVATVDGGDGSGDLGGSDDDGSSSDPMSTDSEGSSAEGSSSNDDGSSSVAGSGGAFNPNGGFAGGGSAGGGSQRSAGSTEFTLSDQQKQEIASSFDKKMEMRLRELRSGLDSKFAKMERSRQALSAAPAGNSFDPRELDGFRAELQRLSEDVQNQASQSEQNRLDLTQKQTAMDQLQQEIAFLKQELESKTQMANRQLENSLLPPTADLRDNTQTAPDLIDLDSYVFRNWTGTNGKVVEMAFIGLKGDLAEFIDRNRTRYECKVSQLSENDQSFIRALQDNR